jgi:hypothetical protein
MKGQDGKPGEPGQQGKYQHSHLTISIFVVCVAVNNNQLIKNKC